jgi:hypothetical protein
MRTIRRKVGKGVSKDGNDPEDVRTVQTLLNQNIAKLVPFMPAIVSGHCDSHTIEMIEEFQRRVLLIKPDGRVDPGNRTIAALNGLSSHTSTAVGAAVSGQAPSAAGKQLHEGGIANALGALSRFVTQKSHADAVRYAITAYFNYAAAKPDSIQKPYLYFVDYGLPRQTRRGFVFDMVKLTLVDRPFTVAHGKGSHERRDGVPISFDNAIGSNATSLGLYLTLGTHPHNGTYHTNEGNKTYSGTSLVLEGESGPDFNSKAVDRLVVIHGAPYVYPNSAGHSKGCPAMEMDRANRLIPLLKEGAVVFLFSPNDPNWMAHDPWVHYSMT